MRDAALPYVNTRLILQSETESEDYFLSGTVVRVFTSPNSHPAARQNLQGLSYRWAGRAQLNEGPGGRAGPVGQREPAAPAPLVSPLPFPLQAREPGGPGSAGHSQQARCARRPAAAGAAAAGAYPAAGES